MTMVVAGHVDAGKSTLLGNLLYKTNVVSQRTYINSPRRAQEIGKGSFALAWVMDGSSSERAWGDHRRRREIPGDLLQDC